MKLRNHISELKVAHAVLNKQTNLTKEEKVKKLKIKDKIHQLELQFTEEYGGGIETFN